MYKDQPTTRKIIGIAVGTSAIIIYAISYLLVAMVRRRKHSSEKSELTVMLTGRVDSKNWANSHLAPLTQADNVKKILSLLDGQIIEHPKIIPLTVPYWLRFLIGRSPARSICTIVYAITLRPDVIMGYHFFPAALSALIAAKISNAHCIYQMTAGRLEIVGAGLATESSLIPEPNFLSDIAKPVMIKLCGYFDAIIVRGSKTKNYLTENLQMQNVHIIQGSIDVKRFANDVSFDERKYDIAFVGRLVPIKQPEHVLYVIAELVKSKPDLRAVIVGDGPLLGKLKQSARALNIQANVEFAGHIENVETILSQSKVFILTSRSESLSIALAEAMVAGAVPVVSDVGDLSDLVKNGKTGWLIEPGNFCDYGKKALSIIDSFYDYSKYSEAAKQLAIENNSLETITTRWQSALSSFI